MALELAFWGGAGKVTGSNFLIASGDTKILIDCGMEQGRDFCESCAYDAFPYAPSEITALIVTHAHLDHVGRIPRLVREGFRGRIFMTPPTKDLTLLILGDSVAILREEAARKARAPLYEEADLSKTMELIETLSYNEKHLISPDISFTLKNSGHILGSASVLVYAKDGTTLAVSSDIGNAPSPLLPSWEPMPEADALVMESVYGDRLHPPEATRVPALRAALMKAIKKGGAILIPAFSMERTQLLLYELSHFFSAKELPPVPVFLDSPLAIAVTDVYEKWGSEYFKAEVAQEIKNGDSLFNFPFLKKTKSRPQSLGISSVPNPKIIIAGAGMSHGGRIGEHEALYLPDPKSTLFIVGYQAPGSPGRLLEDGARKVTLNGSSVTVRAHIEAFHSFSAHADQAELLRFAEAALPGGRLKTIFTALGEPGPARFLAQRINDYLGVRAVAPQLAQRWVITREEVRRLA